jgi:Calcineurin-like phosphoesterase/IPT/TIG domain
MDGQALAADPTENSLHTPAPGEFSFLAVGDSGVNSLEQASMLQQMVAETNISKVIHVGDLAYQSGTFAQFDNYYFGLYASLMSRMPFFATPGNHEYLTNSAAPFLAVHAAPACGVPAQDLGRYYSFDWGDAHFVSIDSNLLSLDAGARMLTWLDADLAATKKYWRVAFVHHPPYPTGAHLGDPLCVLVQQKVNPIVERHGVQLVLAGHEHGYERTFPLIGGQKADPSRPSTTYVITGGGGASLETVGSLPQCVLSVSTHNYLRVDVKDAALTVKAMGLSGAVLDSFTLNPPPVVAFNGIVNARNTSAEIVAGNLVSVSGNNFAPRAMFPSGLSLPTLLGGVSVMANGVAAPLFYVSPTHVSFLMPHELSGQVTVTVSTPNGSATGTASVEQRTIPRMPIKRS